MPCPPSWEEQRQSQLDQQDARTQASLGARASDLVVMREVLVALLGRAALEPVDPEVEQAFEFVSDLRPELPLPAYAGPRPTYRDAAPNMEDMRRAEAAVEYRARLLVRIDLAACVFGCAIARLVAAHGEPTDEPLRARVREAIGRHRAHRLHEREERIAALEKGLATGREAATDAARIARLRALDEATLLSDRHVIHRA